jgi:hypothetical protein
MNRKESAWQVIPATAKWIGLLIQIGFGFILRFAALPSDPQMRAWQEWQKLLFSFGIPVFFLIYALMAGYVYGDAQRRGMRHVMWTFITALMPYAIGFIIYFVIRDPLLAICPSCQTMARPGFAYCPKCGSELKQFCPSCRRPVELDWSNCAFCGCKLNTPAVPDSPAMVPPPNPDAPS